MKIRKSLVICLIFFTAQLGYALQPNQILIIANSQVAESVQIAQYYCAKRGVPVENILSLPLGAGLGDTITRENYKEKLAEPVRRKLSSLKFAGRVRCLLTTYGVPIKVSGRGPLPGKQDKLKELRQLAEQEKNKIAQLEQTAGAGETHPWPQQKKKINYELAKLQSQIDCITGKETSASVDSELSMVLFGDYELYRWQPNMLRGRMPYWDFRSLMVCRLDGPGAKIAQGLIDKALTAETTGLKGTAYIDSGYTKAASKKSLYQKYDQSLRDLAVITKLLTNIPVKQEKTDRLFAPGDCPQTAVYCGWYSLNNYIDAFDFVDGAIGYHIASLEAADLRNPNSRQWCPAMLADGITATLGPVAEPYLHSFPPPKAFFGELFNGRCLVEAYYHTKLFNSWQMVLIGDPLYRPFKKP